MLAITPTPAPLRPRRIARSAEPTGELARRHGSAPRPSAQWRRRGAADCRDRSSRPRKLPWKASEEERAVVCELRRATGFPLDDLTFVVAHFLPHLDRDNVYRILRAAGLSRRPAPRPPGGGAAKFGSTSSASSTGREALPKLRHRRGEWRKRFCSWPSTAARAWSTGGQGRRDEASARAFLERRSRPSRSGSRTCSRPRRLLHRRGLREGLREHGVEHRRTRPTRADERHGRALQRACAT
jgi:hypothetical protein